MRVIFYTMLVCVACLTVCVPAEAQVNGEIVMMDDFKVLRVWGTHQEMGYAHGYLLGDEISELFHQYFLWLIPPTTYENVMIPLFRQYISIPVSYQEEMEGIIDGIVGGGWSLYSEALKRDLTVEDIAIVNCIVDFSQFTELNLPDPLACSSICGWGPGTAPDTAIPGGTIFCRDMDWTDTPGRLLGNRSLIIAYSSSESSEQSWFAVTFPGFIACLSGMNAHGVGATLNMGNNVVQPAGASGVVPICLQVREAVEKLDPNGDTKHDVDDVWHVLDHQVRIPSTIVHAFGPNLEKSFLDPPSCVIESNFSGLAKRIPTDDPVLSPNFIAATNHHRKLYAPTSCWRYSTIQTMVSQNYEIDTAEAWSIENAVGGSWTVQTILFRPDLRDVFVSASTDSTPAPQKTPSYLTWDDVFTNDPMPTPTPSATVPPTQTPVPPTTTPPPPTQTPTQSPYDAHAQLDLSETHFEPGEQFILTFTVTNLSPVETVTGNFWLLLDVYGSYWFYPGWTDTPAFQAVSIFPGMSLGPENALEFDWPAGIEGHAENLHFVTALTNPVNTALFSNAAMVTFSY